MNQSKPCLGILLVVYLVFCILTTGCIENNSLFNKNNAQQPEASIAEWVSAVNNKDIPVLYDLSPTIIRSNISEQDFVRENADNMLLQPGIVFTHLDILNKSSKGTKTIIQARIIMDTPTNKNIPVFITFYLVFENGKWKVWTVDF